MLTELNKALLPVAPSTDPVILKTLEKNWPANFTENGSIVNPSYWLFKDMTIDGELVDTIKLCGEGIYYFTIQEQLATNKVGEVDAVVYDTVNVRTAKVTVTWHKKDPTIDGDKSELRATIEYNQQTDKVTYSPYKDANDIEYELFKNSYDAEGDIVIKGVKFMENRAFKEGDVV